MSAIAVKPLLRDPMKSCGDVEVTEAQVSAFELRIDRRWMLVYDGGVFVAQRERPELAPVFPHVEDG